VDILETILDQISVQVHEVIASFKAR
jgi:hypothetical protein